MNNFPTASIHAINPSQFYWEGDPDGIASLSLELLAQIPDLLDRLPWRLVPVDDEIHRGLYRYYRRAEPSKL